MEKINGTDWVSFEEMQARWRKEPGYQEAYDAAELEFEAMEQKIRQQIQRREARAVFFERIGLKRFLQKFA